MTSFRVFALVDLGANLLLKEQQLFYPTLCTGTFARLAPVVDEIDPYKKKNLAFLVKKKVKKINTFCSCKSIRHGYRRQLFRPTIKRVIENTVKLGYNGLSYKM